MSWDNFKTFNSKLKGADVFKSTYTTATAKEFLKNLADKPRDYGITLDKHQTGVKEVYKQFIKAWKAQLTTDVTVDYYGAKLKIRDFDTALGYIFSTCPLPDKSTPNSTYLPLLAIYCKFMALLVDAANTDGMKEAPRVACVVEGQAPSGGGVTRLMFGATIRVKNKDALQKFRYDQLKEAYSVTSIEKKAQMQSYGHCAETYPFICNLKLSGKPRVFEHSVRGMAVVVTDAAAKTKFELSSFDDAIWKCPCDNCVELLRLGGYPAYDCFPHGSGYREVSN